MEGESGRQLQRHGLVRRGRGRVLWLREQTNEERCGVFLFTGDFPIEARERNGKGLHGTQRVAVVQREDVVGDASELHHDVVH